MALDDGRLHSVFIMTTTLPLALSVQETYVKNLRLLDELYYKPLMERKVIKQKYIQALSQLFCSLNLWIGLSVHVWGQQVVWGNRDDHQFKR